MPRLEVNNGKGSPDDPFPSSFRNAPYLTSIKGGENSSPLIAEAMYSELLRSADKEEPLKCIVCMDREEEVRPKIRETAD